MTLKTLIRAGLAGAGRPRRCRAAHRSDAGAGSAAGRRRAAAPPTVNKGDNAWMLTSTVLVLLMTIPGLALFYGGLVRPKNTLSVLTHVFYTVCIVTLIWVIYGYSLAFTGGSAYHRRLSTSSSSRASPPNSKAATFSVGVNITEFVYICFQMTFAAITPALIVGAFAERMKFSAVALFIPLWVTLVYFPIAHMVWYWAGPDAIDAAAKALAAAADDGRQDGGAGQARRSHGRRRPGLPVGRDRLRRRHRGAHQLPASPVWSARCWSASAPATARS